MSVIKVFDETPEEFYLYMKRAFEAKEITPGDMALITGLVRLEKKLDLLIDLVHD
ncbi:hypothetical protein ES703_15294 [subsurface metagenome]